jgi:hypothetical protein
LAIIVVVELIAALAPAVTLLPISKQVLGLSLLLGSLSVSYSFFVAGWEKARRLLLFERLPALTPNVLATWCFASAILLPPSAAAAVTAASAVGGWRSYNPAGTKLLYRYVYSAMASILAATIASWLFHQRVPLTVALPTAAAAWLLIGGGLTALALYASGQFDAARLMLHPRTYYLEVLTMAVAIAEFATVRIGVPLVWLSLPAAVLIGRYSTGLELRSRKPDTAPMDSEVWLHVAKVVVDASDTVTILRIDTADPQAAQLVAMMQGGCDAIGRYSDGGLAILLPDCPPAQGDAIARRLRIAMGYHKVPCNVAAASKPRDGLGLNSLLAVSEAELVLSGELAKRPDNQLNA